MKKPVSAAEIAHYYNHKESSAMLERLKVDAMIQVAVETKCTGRFCVMYHVDWVFDLDFAANRNGAKCYKCTTVIIQQVKNILAGHQQTSNHP